MRVKDSETVFLIHALISASTPAARPRPLLSFFFFIELVKPVRCHMCHFSGLCCFRSSSEFHHMKTRLRMEAALAGPSLPVRRSFCSDLRGRSLYDSVLHQGYARQPAVPDHILAAVESKLELEHTVALSHTHTQTPPPPTSAGCFRIFEDSRTCVIILHGLITLGKHPARSSAVRVVHKSRPRVLFTAAAQFLPPPLLLITVSVLPQSHSHKYPGNTHTCTHARDVEGERRRRGGKKGM